MTQKRKTYEAVFKRQAVELRKGRKNLSELARELGIRPHQYLTGAKKSKSLERVVFQVMAT